MTNSLEAQRTAAEIAESQPVTRGRKLLVQITGGSTMISILSVLLALIGGGIMIAATNQDVQNTLSYFFARPGDAFLVSWQAVSGAYTTLFQSSVFNLERPDFFTAIKPLTDTLAYATPLIFGGLGVGVAFRAGMFNIGGRGQMLAAASAAGWISFGFNLPYGLHLILAVVVGIAAGALWGGIAGLLKAKTGAHEVIVTIMLNYVAYYLMSWMLRMPGLLQAPGSSNPKTAAAAPTAAFPSLLGDNNRLNLAFILVILATILVWWILNRSSLGFQFRALGSNLRASRVAGINVDKNFLIVMLFSGGPAVMATLR